MGPRLFLIFHFICCFFINNAFCLNEKEKSLVEAIKQNNSSEVVNLIKEGVDVNFFTHDFSYSWTPLMHAVDNKNKELVEILISAGADVNAKNRIGDTALHLAVFGYFLNMEIIELLISKGADINYQDNSGMTVLMKVAASGDLPLTEYLLEKGANPKLKDKDGLTALQWAAGRWGEISPQLVDLFRLKLEESEKGAQ